LSPKLESASCPAGAGIQGKQAQSIPLDGLVKPGHDQFGVSDLS